MIFFSICSNKIGKFCVIDMMIISISLIVQFLFLKKSKSNCLTYIILHWNDCERRQTLLASQLNEWFRANYLDTSKARYINDYCRIFCLFEWCNHSKTFISQFHIEGFVAKLTFNTEGHFHAIVCITLHRVVILFVYTTNFKSKWNKNSK